ncbi:MAG: IclR family transcriptional regulator [Caldiserica bacterium]|jgi:DNA-binding IclR family transcriptional regulator|nr:IclR family transcriptional regulator [Caldisericota bacterium]
MKRAGGKSTVQSVDRALQILEVIADSRYELGLVEISRRVFLEPSTTYRLLKALENHRLVQQDPKTNKYSLGFRAFEIGNSIPFLVFLRSVARGPLETLRDRTGETVNLAIRDSYEAIYLEQIPAQTYTLRVITELGRRVPLHATALGKILLSGLNPEELKNYIKNPLKPYTAKTITDPKILLEQLEEIRKRNWARDIEEFEFGACCVAAGIKNGEGGIVAAISLSGPSIRFGEERISFFLPLLMDTALTISSAMR